MKVRIAGPWKKQASMYSAISYIRVTWNGRGNYVGTPNVYQDGNMCPWRWWNGGSYTQTENKGEAFRLSDQALRRAGYYLL